MACRTTHTFIHVNTVIEVNVIGEVMDLCPFNRLTGLPAFSYRGKVRAVGPDLSVAIHTSLGRRNTGGSSPFYGRVTVAAIDAVIADVVLMTELNGLFAIDERTSVPRRTINLGKCPHGGAQNE